MKFKVLVIFSILLNSCNFHSNETFQIKKMNNDRCYIRPYTNLKKILLPSLLFSMPASADTNLQETLSLSGCPENQLMSIRNNIKNCFLEARQQKNILWNKALKYNDEIIAKDLTYMQNGEFLALFQTKQDDQNKILISEIDCDGTINGNSLLNIEGNFNPQGIEYFYGKGFIYGSYINVSHSPSNKTNSFVMTYIPRKGFTLPKIDVSSSTIFEGVKSTTIKKLKKLNDKLFINGKFSNLFSYGTISTDQSKNYISLDLNSQNSLVTNLLKINENFYSMHNNNNKIYIYRYDKLGKILNIAYLNKESNPNYDFILRKSVTNSNFIYLSGQRRYNIWNNEEFILILNPNDFNNVKLYITDKIDEISDIAILENELYVLLKSDIDLILEKFSSIVDCLENINGYRFYNISTVKSDNQTIISKNFPSALNLEYVSINTTDLNTQNQSFEMCDNGKNNSHFLDYNTKIIILSSGIGVCSLFACCLLYCQYKNYKLRRNKDFEKTIEKLETGIKFITDKKKKIPQTPQPSREINIDQYNFNDSNMVEFEDFDSYYESDNDNVNNNKKIEIINFNTGASNVSGLTNYPSSRRASDVNTISGTLPSIPGVYQHSSPLPTTKKPIPKRNLRPSLINTGTVIRKFKNAEITLRLNASKTLTTPHLSVSQISSLHQNNNNHEKSKSRAAKILGIEQEGNKYYQLYFEEKKGILKERRKEIIIKKPINNNIKANKDIINPSIRKNINQTKKIGLKYENSNKKKDTFIQSRLIGLDEQQKIDIMLTSSNSNNTQNNLISEVESISPTPMSKSYSVPIPRVKNLKINIDEVTPNPKYAKSVSPVNNLKQMEQDYTSDEKESENQSESENQNKKEDKGKVNKKKIKLFDQTSGSASSSSFSSTYDTLSSPIVKSNQYLDIISEEEPKQNKKLTNSDEKTSSGQDTDQSDPVTPLVGSKND